MGRFRNFMDEWKARRAGAKFLSKDLRRSARDIVGPTGNAFSNAWDLLDKDGPAYLESFDRKVPPSIFVSERDRTRWNIPIPLVERCIEDWEPTDDSPEPVAEETGL